MPEDVRLRKQRRVQLLQALQQPETSIAAQLQLRIDEQAISQFDETSQPHEMCLNSGLLRVRHHEVGVVADYDTLIILGLLLSQQLSQLFLWIYVVFLHALMSYTVLLLEYVERLAARATEDVLDLCVRRLQLSFKDCLAVLLPYFLEFAQLDSVSEPMLKELELLQFAAHATDLE
jgi:hypothetical protein